jgi:hypothetical protein
VTNPSDEATESVQRPIAAAPCIASVSASARPASQESAGPAPLAPAIAQATSAASARAPVAVRASSRAASSPLLRRARHGAAQQIGDHVLPQIEKRRRPVSSLRRIFCKAMPRARCRVSSSTASKRGSAARSPAISRQSWTSPRPAPRSNGISSRCSSASVRAAIQSSSAP